MEESVVKSAVSRLVEQRNLIGDGSTSFSLPVIPGKHSDLKSVTCHTVRLLVIVPVAIPRSDGWNILYRCNKFVSSQLQRYADVRDSLIAFICISCIATWHTFSTMEDQPYRGERSRSWSLVTILLYPWKQNMDWPLKCNSVVMKWAIIN